MNIAECGHLCGAWIHGVLGRDMGLDARKSGGGVLVTEDRSGGHRTVPGVGLTMRARGVRICVFDD
jgi:hypothetical protein